VFYYEIGRERLDSVGTQANDYDEIIAQSFKVRYCTSLSIAGQSRRREGDW